MEKRVCNTQVYNLPLSRRNAFHITHLKFIHSLRYSFYRNNSVTEIDLTQQLWLCCSTISGSNGGLFGLFYPMFECVLMLKNILYLKTIFFFAVGRSECVFLSYWSNIMFLSDYSLFIPILFSNTAAVETEAIQRVWFQNQSFFDTLNLGNDDIFCCIVAFFAQKSLLVKNCIAAIFLRLCTSPFALESICLYVRSTSWCCFVTLYDLLLGCLWQSSPETGLFFSSAFSC